VLGAQMSYEDIFKKALSGDCDLAIVQQSAKDTKCSASDIFNGVALKIASEFQSGKLNFEDADFAINELWSVMVDYTFTREFDKKLPEPAYSIYDAFDQGEYDHKDGKDPVEHHTKRLLLEITGGT
tara:strand:+ start:39 stop:416 length:378 start_codon:yes stop_codon:yes gene_type:complete